MTTVAQVRELALSLPRSYEALVRDRVKFRVGRIVFLAFSRDETVMGCGFPKEERARDGRERAGQVRAAPRRRPALATGSQVRLDAIDDDEMHDLVVDAWRMCVPTSLAKAHLGE